MTDKIRAIPRGYHSVTPYLTIRGASKAIEFYKQAFGAQEIMRMEIMGGKIGHAEIKLGDSRIMICDEFPNMGGKSPITVGGAPIMLHFYVDNVDAVVEKAIAAGATLKKPVADQFYGDRCGALTDPFGHEWYVATHVEDVSPAELQRRAEAQMKESAA